MSKKLARKGGINVLSLFDGISCGQLALERAGIRVNQYFASEINKEAIKVTMHHFPNTIQLGDVTKIKGIQLPKIDLILAGSPCQGFSFAGEQLNFKDPRSKLFFEFIRLNKEINPKHFLLENCRMNRVFKEVISKHMKLEPIAINSSTVSAQNRLRLYWTNIPNVSQPKDLGIMLNSIVGEYDGIWVYPRGFNKGGIQSYKGKSPTITTSNWQSNFKIHQNGINRRFTPEECETLQTFPLGYTNMLPATHRFTTIGNGWTVNVISHILSFINTK